MTIYQLPDSGTKIRWRFRSMFASSWNEGVLKHRDFKTKKVYVVGKNYGKWIYFPDFVFEVI